MPLIDANAPLHIGRMPIIERRYINRIRRSNRFLIRQHASLGFLLRNVEYELNLR